MLTSNCILLNQDYVNDLIGEIFGIEDYSESLLESLIIRLKNSTSEGKEPLDIDSKAFKLLKESLTESYAEDPNFNSETIGETLLNLWNGRENLSQPQDNNENQVNESLVEVPNLTKGLYSIFRDEVDKIRFQNFAKNLIISSSVLNILKHTEVINSNSLNSSMIDLQNYLASELATKLGLEPKYIYNGTNFNETIYNELIDSARARFSKYLSRGKYSFPDSSTRDSFFHYLLLTNFDNYLNKFGKGIVSVNESLMNNHFLFSKGNKYFLEKTHVKQNFDEDKSGRIEGNVSEYVKRYITSLQDSKGRNIGFNEFNSILSIIQDASTKISEWGLVRDYPDIALKKVMDYIKSKPHLFFTGESSMLKEPFNVIYNNVFASSNENVNSLYSIYSRNNSAQKNNLYSMICNHLNKISPAKYDQVSWDTEDNSFKVSTLSSVSSVNNRRELNRSLAAAIANFDYSSIFNKYGVEFLDRNGNRINDLSEDKIVFYIKYKLPNYANDFMIPIGEEANKGKFNSYFPNSNSEFLLHHDFFNEVFRKNFNDEFYNNIINLNGSKLDSIKSIYRLAANTLLAAKLKQSGIETSDGITSKVNGLQNAKEYSYFNKNLRILKPDGFNKGIDGAEILADAISFNNKELVRSNVTNFGGASLPKFRMTSVGSDSDYLFYKEKKIAGKEGESSALQYNLFIGSDLPLTTSFQTEVVNFDGTSKEIKNMSTEELLYYQPVFFYFANKKTSVSFQPTVYADKNTLQTKSIPSNRNINYVIAKGKGDNREIVYSVNTPINSMSLNDIKTLEYQTMKAQFEKIKDDIKKDYDKVFGKLHELYGRKFQVRNTYEEYEEELGKISKDRTELNEAILALQKSGEDIEFFPEIHYSYDKKAKKYKFNKTLQNYFDRFVNNDITSTYSEKNLLTEHSYAEALRREGVRFETILSNGEENTVITKNITPDENTENYVKSRLYYFNEKGNYTKLDGDLENKVIQNLKSKFKSLTYKDLWIDDVTKELRPYIQINPETGEILSNPTELLVKKNKEGEIISDSIIILNPELARFKALDNLLSNNLLLATQGLAFLHPTKKNRASDSSVAKTALEESERTVNMYKRGVVNTATGHTLIKNKVNGIPQEYNIAVIEDPESINSGITGDNPDATQFDGSIFMNPLMAIWEANSLPENALSITHRKPLGFSRANRYMSSKLLKCATYSLNNYVVRSGTFGKINVDNLLRNMMDNPWVIPNLDLTEYLKGKTYYYSNPYEDLLGFYSIEDIKKVNNGEEVENSKVNNLYSATINHYKENGSLDTSETRLFSINSNYDLWKVLGGAYSGYFNESNKRFINDESSLENLSNIANEVNIESNSEEVEAYNKFIDSGLLKGKRISIPKKLNISNVTFTKDLEEVIPLHHLKVKGTNTPYYQPLKYSDVHYLVNASAIKNGMSNVNPVDIYYNSVATRISPNDKLIFGHPTLGKTQAEKMGYDILDFDTFIREENNKYIRDNALEGESRGDTLKRIGETPEYQQFVYNKLKEALDTNRQIFFSKTALLKALNNPAINVDEIKLDKLITMSEEDFVRRDLQRGAPDEMATRDWKHNLDNEINTYLSNNDVEVIDATGHNLYEYLGSSLMTSTFDPDYLVIQLNAEHSVEDETITEMTQVISALEQGARTHDLATAIFEDIGRSIVEKLKPYMEWDTSTQRGRQEINRILGKALVRVFNDSEGNAISLASAYLDDIRDSILNPNIPSSEIPNIPFDDNNILSMFEMNFKNGFTKDIIRRSFSGFAAVMTPHWDMYSNFDYNGRTITPSDFKEVAKELGGIKTLPELLSKLDIEVPVSEIREGDWVELNGVPVQVGTLSNPKGGVTLETIKDLRNIGNGTIKRLGSKGRNIRPQIFKIQVADPTSINSSNPNFDAFDLDSVNLSFHFNEFLDLYHNRTPEQEDRFNYLLSVFNEAKGVVDNIYRTSEGEVNIDWEGYLNNWKDGKPKNKKKHQEFISYLKQAIQSDLDLLSEGKFRVPIKYRLEGNPIVDIIGKFEPNDLIVGKPWANKFLLEEGDTIDFITKQGSKFFIDKLRTRTYSPLSNETNLFYFNANNYVLHFGKDSDLSTLAQQGWTIAEAETDIISNNDGKLKRVNDEIIYPVSDGMKFYTLTKNGKSVEFVTGWNLDGVINIWNSKAFYTNTINYPKTGEVDLEDLQKQLLLDKELNDIEINDNFESLDDVLKAYNAAKNALGNNEYRLQKKARKMYISFLEGLKAIAARIPAQSMQSFMNMRISGFAETDTNISYAPISMLIYEGSDFDIDKIYVMGAEIGRSGVYIDWSPYFNYANEDLFELSKELPIPDKVVRAEGITGSDGTINISEFYDIPELLKNKQYRTFLTRLNQFLTKIHNYNYLSGHDSELNNELIKIANRHNSYKCNLPAAIRNRVFSNIFKTGANPKNFISENTVLNLDPIREAASSSPNGQILFSNEDPGTKAEIQKQAAVSKTSIGTYANGIKAFTSLLNYYQSGLENAGITYKNLLSASIAVLNKKGISIEGLDDNSIIDLCYNTLFQGLVEQQNFLGTKEENEEAIKAYSLSLEEKSYLSDEDIENEKESEFIKLIKIRRESDPSRFKLNIKGVDGNLVAYDDSGKEIIIKPLETLPNVDVSKLDDKVSALRELIDKIKKQGIQGDVLDELGWFLNAATDNAKELALKKINGSGELAKIYIYMISIGVPVDTIFNFMTSKAVTLVSRKAESSIFKSELKDNRLTKAIEYYLKGVSLSNFVGKDYVSGVLADINRLVGDTSFRLSKFVETAKISEIEELVDKIYKDDDPIRFNNIKSSGFSNEEDYEYNDEFGFDTRSAKNTKTQVLRYLRECIKRRMELDSMDDSGKFLENLKTLSVLNNGGTEISNYARLCGINQGLKTKREDTFNFIRQIENSFFKFTGKSLDLIEFIINENYRNIKIEEYEQNKMTFNIFDAIVKSPHFSKMYQAFATNELILREFSYKNREFNKIARYLSSRNILNSGKLDNKITKAVNRFLDDVVLNDFFSNLNFSIPFSNVAYPFYYYSNVQGESNVEFNDGNITFENPIKRASFKRIFETIILPKLKKDYPNNSFLSDLTLDYVISPYSNYQFYKLPIDLNNVDELNEDKYTQYVNDYNSIKNNQIKLGDSEEGIYLDDLFFLYNLIINNNRFGPKTFTRILGDSVKENRGGSIISKFRDYMSNLSTKNIDYSLNDLLLRLSGLKLDNNPYTMETENGVNKFYNPDGQEIRLFSKDNTTLLPFGTKTFNTINLEVKDLNNLLVDLISNNKIEIKLTCDD